MHLSSGKPATVALSSIVSTHRIKVVIIVLFVTISLLLTFFTSAPSSWHVINPARFDFEHATKSVIAAEPLHCPKNKTQPAVNPGGSKLAYVTWLSGTVDQTDDLENDKYFVATRILLWHLLHNPATRTKGIDVVVMVDPSVSESRRTRLARDGAILHSVEFLTSNTALHPEQERWKNIMTKLRVFQMTQYSRILMLDGDMMLLHPLDGVFDDPGAQIQVTQDHEPTKLAALPPTYLLAGISEPADSHHHFPVTKAEIKDLGYMNAGFFMLAPSEAAFEHYRSYLDVPDSFRSTYMEQDLLNQAHKWTGPMPWKELNYKWNVRYPTENDFERGLVSMHEKWWEQKYIYDNEKVKNWLQSRRWEMKGWYDAYDRMDCDV